MDLQRGAVSTYEIINMLKGLEGVLAKQLVTEYIEFTGDKAVDEAKFEDWIAHLRINKI